ncbi:MAG: hypothetical protein LBU62_10240 [Bacteroidales bacterium]|jgi:predicted phage terminase large subunit-like protein|nr:hypothetical protein [Bacteroidales bacterium]
MNTKEIKDALQKWNDHCTLIRKFTTVDDAESKEARTARIARLRKDYSAFVDYYFPHYAKCRCGAFQIKAANYIRDHRNMKAVFKWARAHAKSTHMDIMIPMWLKCQENSKPETRNINVMVLVSKSEENADTLLSDIQAELQFNQRYISDFGPQYNAGSWQDGEFATQDGVAFFSCGRGQSPRGLRYRESRPDYIVVDDIDDDELVENDKRVRKATEWVTEALFGALDGGRGRFMMVGNLISKNSVLAKIATKEGVYLSEVNVYDKAGNVTWDGKWSKKEIQDLEQFMGYRSFQKEFMNNPVTEGAVFRNDWIHWKKLPHLRKYESIVAYCDPSFKGSTRADYKAIKVWGKIASELHNIRNFVRQCSTTEMVRWFYDLHESLPEGVICDYYIEANFLQDILLDEFETEGKIRGYQLPIRPDHRKKPDKFQRIESISPLWERGFVFYDERLQNDRDTLTGLEQLLAFEKGTHTHDDAPDADEGAIYILQKRGRIESFTPRIGQRTSSKNIW